MKKTAETTFDAWALNGRDEGMERGHFPRAEQVLSALSPAPGGSYIDLGCGNGWAARWMRELTGKDGSVIGIDVAANMIERANALTSIPGGIEFRRAAFEQLPFENNTFHGAFSMEALYYSTDLHAALQEIFRVLRPHGTLAFCTDFFEENPHCHDWPAGLEIPMELLSETGWSDAFENAGLQVVRSFRCLDHRDDNATADAATIDFRTRIGALGIMAIKPESQPEE